MWGLGSMVWGNLNKSVGIFNEYAAGVLVLPLRLVICHFLEDSSRTLDPDAKALGISRIWGSW